MPKNNTVIRRILSYAYDAVKVAIHPQRGIQRVGICPVACCSCSGHSYVRAGVPVQVHMAIYESTRIRHLDVDVLLPALTRRVCDEIVPKTDVVLIGRIHRIMQRPSYAG